MDPMPTPDPIPLASAATLSYEVIDPTAPRHRPKWVYAIVITYALLILGGVCAIVIPLAINREGGLHLLVGAISILFVGQTSLIFVPVRVNSRRPFTRRS